MKLHNLLLLLFILLAAACGEKQDPTSYVDPFIGTAYHGHTFPGPTMPFGMVQLSPDTGTRDWDWCSGYHSSDSSIIGFSHKHLSGTGGADLGDILLMPTVGKIRFASGTKDNPDAGYRSRFKHSTEKASPGYYSVQLEDYNVKAELTATQRVGVHRYTFPKTDTSNIILDLQHGISDRVTEAFINVLSSTKLEGLRRSQGWAKDQYVYFAIELSKPFKSAELAKDGEVIKESNRIEGKNVKAAFTFSTADDESVIVKVGISSVDTKGAWANLNKETPDFNFDKIRTAASVKWDTELSKIIVEGGTAEQKTVFYTALYHSMIAPNIFMDVDKRYRGMDNKIHTAEDHDHYTLFSLWDTFRATHPLFTLIDQKRTNDFIKTMYYKYTQFGNLPVWELDANETWCMIGYHSIPVIADAYMKGIIDYNVNDIYDAIKTTSMKDINGLEYLKEMDYIPMDKEPDAASKTLEYAYDDWCIAQMAKQMNKTEDYQYYMHRAMNYKNLFDTSTGFMRGKYSDGTWKKDFNPAEPFPLGSGEFTEGSSWQYTWFVPHDVKGLIKLMGGDDAFESKLDQLFEAPSDENYKMPSDVTGLIGQYAHGNEPSHHIPYLYNYLGKPYKTAEKVRQIMSQMYHSGRDGLCGNEDCGQMSAWYVFSAMGFYPVTPASNSYAIGSLIFNKVTINLENGKQIVFRANNNSDENLYVQSMLYNNEEHSKAFITHEMLKNGGELLFNMGSKPSEKFGILGN